MWEGIIDIPPPPEPPYDIETMGPIRVPALFRWASEQDAATIDASEVSWEAPELPLDDERILVLDGSAPGRRVFRLLIQPYLIATRRTSNPAGRESSAL